MSGNVVLVLCPQAAQSVNKALEQFVKPEQLDGENSYKCSKYDGWRWRPHGGRGGLVWKRSVCLRNPGLDSRYRLGRPWVSLSQGPGHSVSRCLHSAEKCTEEWEMGPRSWGGGWEWRGKVSAAVCEAWLRQCVCRAASTWIPLCERVGVDGESLSPRAVQGLS